MPRSPFRPARSAVLLALLASACDGGGGGGGGGGGIVEPPPVPQDTLQRLLTDAELVAPEDFSAPAENAAWVSWVAANHVPLRSLTSTDYQDLQFLKPLLASRRLVQMGESGHGVRQFSQAKIRLVRFLHEEMGYDVIAFESSMHDCWQANRALAAGTSAAAMRECLFQVWHTTDLLALLDYVRQTAGTARPLVLAGFDVQPTSRGDAGRARAGLLGSVVGVVDGALAARVQAVDADLAQRYEGNVLAYSDYVVANADSLTALYGRAEELIRQNRAALDAHFAADPQKAGMALATARSMRVFIRQLTMPGSDERYSARDAGMADNVDFLLDDLYRGKKVMVWAHNSHITNAPVLPTRVNMGTRVHERRGAEVYTLGLYMYAGSAADNGRQVYPIPLPHRAGTLESILYGARRRWTFVDFSTRANGPGTAWMFQETPSRAWGLLEENIVPARFYDGVLFIHTASPPPYVQ